MKIWLTRHGQTDLNKEMRMQGRSNMSLNAKGIEQAKAVRAIIGDVTFDVVYASPLNRAVQTASIVGNVKRDQILTDDRIMETDFGKYEKRSYFKMGLAMSMYWALPEVFRAPKTVEPIASMVERAGSFLKDLEEKDYENVLVVCHGGIIRVMRGYLEDISKGYRWRPKPKNCEVTVYEAANGKHRTLMTYGNG